MFLPIQHAAAHKQETVNLVCLRAIREKRNQHTGIPGLVSVIQNTHVTSLWVDQLTHSFLLELQPLLEQRVTVLLQPDNKPHVTTGRNYNNFPRRFLQDQATSRFKRLEIY